MRDPSDEIRKWLYGVLNGNVTYNSAVVPVYSFPPKDAAMPYIQIAEQSSGPDEGTKDCYITRHTITLEIYTAHTGNDASYVAVNTISDYVLELARTRAKVTGLKGFNVISCVADSMITDRYETENRITIFKVIPLTLLIEELQITYSDWFLPSKDELYRMWEVLYYQGNTGGFSESEFDYYWSSSEYNATTAYALNFLNSTSSVFSKAIFQLKPIRPCRTFTSGAGWNLGDEGPGGGMIFHIVNNGDGTYTYGQAYIADLSTGTIWSNVDDISIGTTGTAIGTGLTNTQLIINQIGHSSSAAKECDNLN